MAIDNLSDPSLTRAHIVTVFFFSGVGSGHRMRQYFDGMSESVKARETAQALVDSLDMNRDDPFCVGWGYGWELELSKGCDGKADRG